MEFSFFFGDGFDRAVGDTGAAEGAVVVYASVGPHGRLKRSGGDDAEVTARDALACDEPFGKAEGPKAGGIGGVPFRPVGRIKALFGFIVC